MGMALATHTSGYFPRKGDWGTVVVKMEEDGSVHVNCNVHDHGCGEVMVFRSIVAEVLSISPDLVDLPEGDTAYNALGQRLLHQPFYLCAGPGHSGRLQVAAGAA